MNKFFRLAFLLLLSIKLISCRESKNFQIEGDLAMMQSAEIRLMHLGVDRANVVDSVFLESQTHFELGGELSEPSLYSLRIKDLGDIFLVVHPGDKIELQIADNLKPFAYTVSGSTDSRLVSELMIRHMRVRDEITRISQLYEESKLNPLTFESRKQELDSLYDDLLRRHKQFSQSFIEKNQGSLACLFALYQNFGRTKDQALFDSYHDIKIFNLVDSNLTLRYPKTQAVQALNRDVTEIKEQFKQKNYSEQLISPGRKAPEFEITTVDSQLIRLSDYPYEPVVYIFFATWNKNSVQEVLALNQLIQKYPFQRLNVVGISFDTRSDSLQAFIQRHAIRFPVACDYQYWESAYVNQFGLLAIPDILLLNRNHIVDKRNLSTAELEQIITEWKKNNLF